MKKIMLVAISTCALIAVLAISGCSSSNSAGYAIGDGSVSVEGKNLTVNLEGNPTTGYEWRSSISGDNLVMSSSDYKAQGSNAGSGGAYVFAYQGAKSGDCKITLTYSRAWETTASDKSVEIEVKTDSAGNIKQTKTTCSDGTGGESK